MGERVIMDPLPKKNHVTALVTVTWVKGSLIDLSHLSIIILVPAFFGLDTSKIRGEFFLDHQKGNMWKMSKKEGSTIGKLRTGFVGRYVNP